MGGYIYAFLALFSGWASGVLLNYLADILPHSSRSAAPVCLRCGKPLDLKNYFLWPRKCGSCSARRSWRTWIVEILAAGGGLWLWLAHPGHLGFVAGLVLLMYCGLIVIIDVEHHLILHSVSLAGVIFGFGIGIWMHGVWGAFLGGAIGFGVMLFLYYAGIVLLKIINKKKPGFNEDKEVKEALGFGDVILGGIIGLMLGDQMILTGLVVAVFVGCIYSLLYLFLSVVTRHYKVLSMIPYGPFLVASMVILLYFPETAAVLAARL